MSIVAPGVARPTNDRAANARRELVIVVLGLAGYFGLRLVVEGDRPTAIRNAERLLDLERRLGIDVELDLQAWVLEHDVVRWILSTSYVWLHWPLLIAVMVVLTWRAPGVQARLRNAILASAGIGVLLFALVPTAPPRFMPGYVGTVSDAARRHFLPYPMEWTNQVAAFPSYHVGWTLIACLAFAGAVRSRWVRTMAATAAGLVTLAVVGTGNHYVLDTVTGACLALLAWWAVGRWSVRDGEDGDGAGRAVDADERTVGDPARGIGRRDDTRPSELAGDDDRVAHLATHVHHDGLDGHEQRGP